jgi:hypothetical protein
MALAICIANRFSDLHQSIALAMPFGRSELRGFSRWLRFKLPARGKIVRKSGPGGACEP